MMLANQAQNATFAQEALRPIAYTLPSIGTYAADFNYRSALPTFMLISSPPAGWGFSSVPVSTSTSIPSGLARGCDEWPKRFPQ
jgi:hypothetical protein